MRVQNGGLRLFGRRLLCLSLLALQLSGCATSSYIFNRGAFCEDTAVKNGFTKKLIKTENFTLLAYCRFAEKGKPVVIYIEGDGTAWESRSRLSQDPTPKDALAIDLASIDPAPNVAYLARPGQYSLSGASVCEPSYWSDKRFSEEVIGSMNEAVDRLKEDSRAGKIDIVGYSGGAAIGVLIAARRNDIESLRTIAGNLGHEPLSRYHGVSALTGSLDPIDSAEAVSKIPQRHFVGSRDGVIPPSIAESFVERTGDAPHKRITMVEGASHSAGWRERWLKLLSIAPQ